jgi:succinate-acetate transporter protein
MSDTASYPIEHHEHHNGSTSAGGNGLAKGSASYHEERFAQLERTITAHGHRLETAQAGFPVDKIHRKLAICLPLGTYTVGATTWLLGMLLVNARHTTLPNGWFIVGLPMGGILTLLAGLGEFFTGNTFGATLLTSVGAIVICLVLPFLPWTSIGSSIAVANQGNLAATGAQVNGLAGMYLLVAMGILFLIMLGGQKTAISIIATLVEIILALITFAIGLMTGNTACIKVSMIRYLAATRSLELTI